MRVRPVLLLPAPFAVQADFRWLSLHGITIFGITIFQRIFERIFERFFELQVPARNVAPAA
jgi:hypothetical protein